MGQDRRQKKRVKSWMWEHVRDCYGGVVGISRGMEDYRVNVTGTFRKTMNWQVDEDQRMQECENLGHTVLNSKHEWFTPKGVQYAFRQL